MAFFRKKVTKETYDMERQKPVLKCSICTGEQVAGFLDIHTGVFEDVMLVRSAEDLQEFRDLYGIKEELSKIY